MYRDCEEQHIFRLFAQLDFKLLPNYSENLLEKDTENKWTKLVS